MDQKQTANKNAVKRKPKGEIKFAIALNEEQKAAKTEILKKFRFFL